MSTAVVDASYAGAWVLPDEISGEAETILKQAIDGKIALAAPDLWHYEMCNLLVMACRRGRIREDQIQEGTSLLAALPLEFYDHHEALSRRRIVIFATRYGLSAYDAAYLELADRLQCPLLTADGKLRAAAVQSGLQAAGSRLHE